MTEAEYGSEVQLRLFTDMLRIRLFEERVADLVEAGEIRTPCHLYIGQEAVAVGACSGLRTTDTVWGGHRSHGHYLAKGGDLKAMMAEIFTKETGCSGGRGGSMHLYAPEVGILGTVPLVAATIPLAVGAALTSKLSARDDVAVTFFGDGATEEGHFHEAVNLAALYNLPVIFICENNLFASHLPLAERRRHDNIVDAATAHGIPGEVVDGNDVLAARNAMDRAVERARSGSGPTLLEMRTYRWRGHVGASWDLDVGVKRKGELAEWLAKDPIARLAGHLQEAGIPSEQLSEIRRVCELEVEASVESARSAHVPPVAELFEHVFVESAK